LKYVFVFLFSLVSITSLNAADYTCDLIASNPKVKWNQISNFEYTEVPFFRPGILGYYKISFNNDYIKISNINFVKNFYEDQKRWSNEYIENLFNDIFYKEKLSKINRTYMSMLIMWLDTSYSLKLENIDGFEKFNGSTSSLHSILRSIPESKKNEYYKFIGEFFENYWNEEEHSKSTFIRLEKSINNPQSLNELNKLLNHKDLRKSKINSDLKIFYNDDGLYMNIKFKNLYANNKKLRISTNLKSTAWINGFMFNMSIISECSLSNSISNKMINLDEKNMNKEDSSIKDKLRELKSMLDEGLISQELYDTKSTKLLEDF